MKHILYIIILCFAYTTTIWAENYIIINQVMYDSPLNERVTIRPYSHGEFIELYNAGTSSVALTGWTLTGSGSTEKVEFPSNLSMPAGSYLIIAYRYSTTPEFQLNDLFTLPTGHSNYAIYYQSKLVLSNSGETLTLKNANNIIVDRLVYDGTSNKSNPNRLHAENSDSINGNECKSLHRTGVEFNEYGHASLVASTWDTDDVSFAMHRLSQSSYYEDYLTDAQPLPSGENYIVSITPLDKTNRISENLGNLSVSSNVRTSTTVTYYDGFGRPYESVSLQQSPNRNDLISMTSYNGLNRATHQWLPISEDANGQALSPSEFSNKATTFYGDSRPYQETLYESSALDRIVGAVRPGAAYATHPSTQTYEINAESNIKLFSVVWQSQSNGAVETRLKCGNSNYGLYTLYKSTTSDEDGKSITTFTDKLGRVILERQDGNDTYYVYDNKGQLCYVLPPLASNQISAGTYSNDTDVLKKYAYVYKYDERGNQIYKRLPGCEPTLMVYDVTNMLVMSQTGNQRERGSYWTVHRYDSLRRSIYTSEVNVGGTYEDYLSSFRNWYMREQFSTGTHNYPMANTGYSRGYFHNRPTELLTVNYYDTYDFLQFVPNAAQSHMAFAAFSGNNSYANAQGLLTGTRTYYLDGSGNYSETVYYYDYRGREIQRRSTNHLGGYDVLSTKYNFSNITDTWSSQSTQDGLTTSEHYQYTYDHANRPLTTTYTLNNGTPITLQSYHYDELGRVRSRHLYGGIDSIAFSYDMRNQITQIKSSGYEQNYYYHQQCPMNNGLVSGVYNGNICATTWSYGNKTNGYEYTYDYMNRLATTYGIVNGVWADGYYSENFTYDAHGNIKSIRRCDDHDIMNNLNMIYDGNQLVRVNDTGLGSYDYSIKQYHDNNSSVDFAYDENGNMKYDKDRGIATIRYNLLNLPETIQFSNGNQIVHRYDAAGNRLATDYYTRKINVTVPLGEIFSAPDSISKYHVTRDAFHNNMVYNVDNANQYSIEFVHNPEGYIRYLTPEECYPFYYIKDLLGNVRETYVHPEAGYKECIQRMQYYPSGLPWLEAYSPSEQPWKYNGKEFVEMHGLDEYDSEARWYYPAICRTTTMDPLAEKYYAISPYAWCGNNPVNCIDPLGLDTIRVTYEKDQWNISDPIIAEGNDVIIVTDEEGNEETITYDEGEYGKRVIMLTLSYGKTKDDESFGVYHVSGASQNGTGFYVTRGGNSLSKGSGEGVPEGDYPILKPFDGADWQQAGLGGDIALRGIRFHPGTSYKSSEGCYILFTDYEISNGKTTFSIYNSRLAVKNFNILLGADPNKADYYYRSKKTGRDRYGAYFPNGIKNKRLIQKYRK